MKPETKQALRRSLFWSALLAVTLSAVGTHGVANNHSLDFFWFLGAPYALLIVVSFTLISFAPSVVGNTLGHLSGAGMAHPVATVVFSSIMIALAWGLGFLWPHLAFCATRQRKFLVRLWSFVGWSAFSIAGTMAFMFWMFSEMGD